MTRSIQRTHLYKAQKQLFKQSFQDFKKFMQSEGIWKTFKWEIFKRYGWINIENMRTFELDLYSDGFVSL